MFLPALGILCGFTAVVLAAMAATRASGGAAFLVGIAGTALLPAIAFDPVAIATLATAASGLALWRPRYRTVLAVCAGALTWCWTIVLASHDIPREAAAVLTLIVVGATAIGARYRESFAPARLREEALLIVLLLGIVVAAAPAVSSGYLTAAQLRAVPLGDSSIPLSAGAFAIAGACGIGGALFSLWRRR